MMQRRLFLSGLTATFVATPAILKASQGGREDVPVALPQGNLRNMVVLIFIIAISSIFTNFNQLLSRNVVGIQKSYSVLAIFLITLVATFVSYIGILGKMQANHDRLRSQRPDAAKTKAAKEVGKLIKSQTSRVKQAQRSMKSAANSADKAAKSLDTLKASYKLDRAKFAVRLRFAKTTTRAERKNITDKNRDAAAKKVERTKASYSKARSKLDTLNRQAVGVERDLRGLRSRVSKIGKQFDTQFRQVRKAQSTLMTNSFATNSTTQSKLENQVLSYKIAGAEHFKQWKSATSDLAKKTRELGKIRGQVKSQQIVYFQLKSASF
jgi:hypothetical protein